MGVFSNWADNKLIEDWRQAFRFRIIQLHTAITVIAGIIYNAAKQYPDLAKQSLAYLPSGMFSPLAINMALLAWLLLGAYARLVYQPPKGC